MNQTQALTAFAALSQDTRLKIVRCLVAVGPEGMAAGVIGAKVDGSASRMSFHLSHLERSGLIASRRDGRQIIYRAVYPALSGLIGFLMQDCCQGHPEICAPFADGACDAGAGCCDAS